MKFKEFIGATTLLLSAPFAAANESLVIDNVTVISPELAQPLGNRHVFIRDGRIEAVSGQPIAAPTAVRRLDGTGKFLTPGIMDGHVHVSQAVGLPFDTSDPAIAALEKEFFAQQPRSYLYFGVTQVLDPSNLPERVAVFAAQPRHPDIFRCGAAPVVDGYPLVFIDKAVRHKLIAEYIFEPANAREHPLPDGVDPLEHTPEAVVAKIAASGARCVKMFLEDGFGPRTDWPLPSVETLRRVRTAAHKHGLLLSVHANALDMQRRAVAENVDLIVHGVWNWNEFEGKAGMPTAIAEHLRSIRDHKIGYQATLRVLPGVTDLLNPDTLNDPMYPKVVPPRLLAWYRTEPAQWFKQVAFGADVDGAALVAQRRAANEHWTTSEQGMRALRQLYELGQPMLLGSDTPSAPTYGNQPGYDTYREMQLMAQAGIPLKAIFDAATINNARQFRMAKDYGTIERGKIANLLLLEGNPLASVEAWNRIEKVILHGEPIERETLAADRVRQSLNFHEAAESINNTIRANHFHRADLVGEAYRQIEADVIALGEKAQSADEFMNGFNAIWRKGPFSHVALQKAQEPAADRIARLDTQIAGADAVTLAWNGSAAILTINTMSGADTLEAIDAAYAEIVARKAAKLIIDLRRNGGGAFAVVPLVGHLIDKPIDAGVFVVGSWYADHQQPPGPADFPSATPWRGYSVKAFQADVLMRPLTSYRIDPMKPLFQGPVVVLTSARSISAAEIAADALKSTSRAKIIGEKTPGAVLSSKLFDVPGGFHLRVPIADYYSIKNGRLEGNGVTPDIPVSADRALDVALEM